MAFFILKKRKTLSFFSCKYENLSPVKKKKINNKTDLRFSPRASQFSPFMYSCMVSMFHPFVRRARCNAGFPTGKVSRTQILKFVNTNYALRSLLGRTIQHFLRITATARPPKFDLVRKMPSKIDPSQVLDVFIQVIGGEVQSSFLTLPKSVHSDFPQRKSARTSLRKPPRTWRDFASPFKIVRLKSPSSSPRLH